jgi:hypothetical protein
MGRNGGFNPYRDANGEYATPERAGKPGRNRKRGASQGRPRGGAAVPGPGERVTRSNPTIEAFTFNQANLPFSGLANKGSGALYKRKVR